MSAFGDPSWQAAEAVGSHKTEKIIKYSLLFMAVQGKVSHDDRFKREGIANFDKEPEEDVEICVLLKEHRGMILQHILNPGDISQI